MTVERIRYQVREELYTGNPMVGKTAVLSPLFEDFGEALSLAKDLAARYPKKDIFVQERVYWGDRNFEKDTPNVCQYRWATWLTDER